MIHHEHIISRINEAAATRCPKCSGTVISRCRCSGSHTLEDLQNGHGMVCSKGHHFSGQLVVDSIGLTPNAGVGTMAGNVASGDSSTLATQTKKEGDEFKEGDPEERQEIKIADAILQAASGLADSPAAEEIIRQAQELKRIHGVV